MTLTRLLVPTYTQMLKALSAWLEKAEQEAADPDQLMAARLAPDMFPLATQVRFSCLQAQEPIHRLQGAPLPEALDALAQEGQNADNTPGSISDAQARINEALSMLAALTPNALDDGAEATVSLELANGMIFDMTGEQYARDWALPQFYFHMMTAYSILRKESIPLGKPDYVAHMFAYLRPGTAPAA